MYKLIMEEYKLLINILSATPPRIFLSFSPSFLLSHVDASILKIKKLNWIKKFGCALKGLCFF